MTYSSCLTDEDRLLVLDASVVINLLATGCSREILAALNRPILLPEPVVREVEHGEERGHGTRVKCRELLAPGHIEIAELDSAGLSIFMGLVGGTTSSSLGDGEAATIAIASIRPACAIIDEKKATKIMAASFKGVRAATTIDVLSHRAILTQLGREALAAGVNAALREARMQVRLTQFGWVRELIGEEAVERHPSMSRLARAARGH
jgi:predicted nucleic acid-binding protein